MDSELQLDTGFSSCGDVGRSMRREERFRDLIASHMSPDLQGIVISHCYARYLQEVPFFQYNSVHLRGIRRLRAEEETTRFLTQV
jgi:hypothetical protein